MAKAVKLSDIAAKIGVSTVTVSKALSGQKGMSDELRERIVALADEMGYVKRVQNKEKETGRSFNLGVIVAERYIVEKQSFYWNIYQEISQRAIKKRCFTMIEIVEYAAENGCVMPILLSENKVDGIIVMGAFGKKYMKAVERWTKDFPVLYFDTTIGDEAGDYIVSNNLYGGYNMTNYLLDRGHKKIGFVGTRLMIPSIDDRFFGYLKALMERGIEYRKDWIIDDRDNVEKWTMTDNLFCQRKFQRHFSVTAIKLQVSLSENLKKQGTQCQMMYRLSDLTILNMIRKRI